MNYLKMRPDGTSVANTSKVTINNGTLSIRDDGGAEVEVSNATQHVEAFTRKVNTILLVCSQEPQRAGQDGTGSSDPTRQMTLDDASFVLGILRENQRLVSKEAMGAAIVTLEREIRDLHIGQGLKTLGAAFKAAGISVRTLLALRQTQAVAVDATNKAAGVSAEAKDETTEVAKLTKRLEEQSRHIDKLKNGTFVPRYARHI